MVTSHARSCESEEGEVPCRHSPVPHAGVCKEAARYGGPYRALALRIRVPQRSGRVDEMAHRVCARKCLHRR